MNRLQKIVCTVFVLITGVLIGYAPVPSRATAQTNAQANGIWDYRPSHESKNSGILWNRETGSAYSINGSSIYKLR